MEAGTVTVATEDKQQQAAEDTGKDSLKNSSQPNQPDAKGKDAPKDGKVAPERKRTRNLSEDKRFKLFSGTANRPLAEAIGRHIGNSSLINAVRFGFSGVAIYLAEHKADANLADHSGWTPLMFAAWDDDPALVKMLLAHGARLAAEFDALWALTKRGVTEASGSAGASGSGASARMAARLGSEESHFCDLYHAANCIQALPNACRMADAAWSIWPERYGAISCGSTSMVHFNRLFAPSPITSTTAL